IVRADDGGLAVVRRAMDGDALAKNIVVADLQARAAAFVFQVLRFHADGGEGKNFIPLPQPRVAVHDNVRMQFAVLAERDVFADDAVRPDVGACRDVGFRVNNGREMNHEVIEWRIMYHASRSINVTCASLTMSPSTLHTPLALPILPRIFVSSISITSTSPGTTGLDRKSTRLNS